jgi:hypothetical protein
MTVNDYWQIISRRHQIKVRMLADKHNVSVGRAFRNIVDHLKQERSQIHELGVFNGYVTADQIEHMIDTISR